jgi:DedD protein
VADKQDTSQDFNPKHRVVGAIILVALAVVLVPLILHNRAPSTPTQPMAEMPAPDTRLVVTPMSPVPLPENPSAPTTIKTIPSLVAPATPPAGNNPAPVISEPGAATESAEAPPVTKTVTKPAASPAGATGKGWIVQVGAFSNRDNAARLKETLVRHGYAPELDKISLNKGQGVRVRVGPYASEAEARTAESRIQRELGIKGVVRVYP